MTEYVVGRRPEQTKSRVVVTGDDTVSASHCILSPLERDVFRIEDLASTNGTFVRDAGYWRRISSAQIKFGDEIRLGNYCTTAEKLMANAIEVKAKLRISRNPDTGEIEKTFE